MAIGIAVRAEICRAIVDHSADVIGLKRGDIFRVE
jgi:hypothetical protein